MNTFWHDKIILVTGGSGFLGRHVVRCLTDNSPKRIVVPRKSQYDLTQAHVIRDLLSKVQPHIVIHLAASVGGIQANQMNPGRFFYENLMMGAQMMEYSRQCAVDKFVAIGSVCAYPKITPIPFREENLWDGYPEETNAPYGLAKKMLLVQSQAYRQQYNFNSIYLLPVNLYGPGDNFDPLSSHVIPAVIRKCILGRRDRMDEIEVGGTGQNSREFLYVTDAARAIVLAAEHYNMSDPVNIGVGKEITIKELVALIADLVGYNGRIRWRAEFPDGQPRRCLDTSKADKLFGFCAKKSLREGLEETIRWYEHTLGSVDISLCTR